MGDDGVREWVGGRWSPPFFVADREEPYRVGIAAWVELPSGVVVGHQVFGREDAEGALGRVLRAALDRPAVGPPREPEAIRVADRELVGEVRGVLGERVPVTVAPTPEIEELAESMAAGIGASEADHADGYLGDGRISEAAVEELFVAAQFLWLIAPWEVASDDQVLRLDIPELGVEGACVSVLGALGEVEGLVIFPSMEGYEAFVEAVEGEPPFEGLGDPGTGWLALFFESLDELPEGARREAEEHDWPTGGRDAYPLVERRDRDGVPRPLIERDVRVAAACARAVATLFAKHGERLAEESPMSESYFDEDDTKVRLTLPYGAHDLFESDRVPPWRTGRPVNTVRRERPKVGRNDPCPCGSGRKYKKCHLHQDEREGTLGGAPVAGAGTLDALGSGDGDLPASAHPAHVRDERLVTALVRYARRRFPESWSEYRDHFVDADEALQLSVPWAVYAHPVDGSPVVDWYLREHGEEISARERQWLRDQRAAWLSVWEVLDVEPGEGMTLRDLLSGQEREVVEASGSRGLVPRDALLARVVDHDGDSLLCGAHPQPLPPRASAEALERARKRLRRKGDVPVDRLRDAEFGRHLIRYWEEAIEDLWRQSARAPTLHNTDGDPLLLTTDHFDLEPGERDTVAERLASLEGVGPPEREDGCDLYWFMREADPDGRGPGATVLGRAELTRDALSLATNSERRADALRERVQDACGDRIRHRAREHADPLSSASRLRSDAAPEPLASPEADELVAEFKRRHYADWPDHPLPALGGRTPREAVESASGRREVDLLLREMENTERRGAGPAAFDFSELRRDLGLDSD